ncbi:DUF2225 domain-containing protein [Clostridiaceae bacterium UIB06]|uniref:DUF2225 domain-containing protein n=1 Tax=Clostridium thailandense TaxID=2794346 RepID=A0A949TMT7_9CLOT|nr:DUF2225 domain-containing protein [Clostridium thailandense]MBV7272172.1 DUF2225 domain-containing protein [Clostridium thailandense]MCH5135975.1 DUF2225 domain-containing protein [Clostridiaceae bacterium UIB06]
MPNDIFSGLEDLGFEDIENVNLYKKEETEKKTDELQSPKSDEEKQKSLLYDSQVTCPVCESSFKARTVKSSAYRILKKDSDSFIHFNLINPYFYDVWVCPSCGYSSMKSDFNKIRSYHIEVIKQKITTKWRGRTYPDVYDIDIAIERYKLSLLNYTAMDAKASKKAMNCLKLAWMYRIKEDRENELAFLNLALDGFSNAFYDEDFPIYEMNKFTIMYLIGELNRRVEKHDVALTWFSRVITSPSAPQKLKDKTRDQRDLVEESIRIKNSKDTYVEENLSSSNKALKEKKGFFSKFFK